MKSFWQKYANVWSTADERDSALKSVVDENVRYRDPTNTRTGIRQFSDYMSSFQKAVPGGRFIIHEAFEHNDRTLSRWSLLDSTGTVLQNGISFAVVGENKKFTEITGFFLPQDTSEDKGTK
ncbi:MAG: ester cyclase [Sneathiellales bacterium]|nr:ester cyclase [Sneathiellales bacterium]